MTKQFPKIHKMLSLLIDKIEREAVDNGEDISTDKFQATILKLKEKILENKGITLEEYNDIIKEKPEEIELKIV